MFRYRAEQKEDKRCFIIYNLDGEKTSKTLSNLRGKEVLKLCSIDVGIANLAIRIEKRRKRGLNTIRSSFLNSDVLPYFFLRKDLAEGTNVEKSKLEPVILHQCTEYLEELLNDLERNEVKLDLIVIERQLPVNVDATRTFQHILTTLLLFQKYGLVPPDTIILDIHPNQKYSMLGCPSELNTKGKKKWGIEKAKDILQQGNDTWSLEVIQANENDSTSKGDDLADTVTQINAILFLMKL